MRVVIRDKVRRQTISTRVDVDLLQAIKINNLSLADVINTALREYLRNRGFI